MEKKTLKLSDLLDSGDGAKRISELSFEGGLKLLEELVESVEAGTLSLDKSIVSYEKGAALISHLRNLLSGAEEKLKILNKAQ